ncbi:hypothetical protein E4U42_003570 [Claviceps africana]|uniref:Uncharacterized protein n=1 Tax=Claviceps africana TaxID=83212 RepID=A0A8K0NIQ8_9HYPO|nr:hypothetical protein E4U42_003570 [Claviceps africana]
MAAVIPAPDPARLLAPILPVLPVAAACAQPAAHVLPLLSPILRQRVQLLSGPGSGSGSASESWLRLLCYDAAKAVRLAAIACGPDLEPHPVSGEVEVDWARDAETRFRRLDHETLQALVALPELGLAFRLVYCVDDKKVAGGGGDDDGWRIGEVTVTEKPLSFSQFGDAPTIAEAERRYKDASSRTKAASAALTQQEQQQVGDGGGDDRDGKTTSSNNDNNNNNNHDHDGDDDDDDDDDYWNLYDKTPEATPAANRSPAPRPTAVSSHNVPQSQAETSSSSAAEDAYFSQYAHVQPAMDNHDPDEEAHAAQLLHNPPAPMPASQSNTYPESELKSKFQSGFQSEFQSEAATTPLRQPYPDSSTSSPASNTVARLEYLAGQQAQNEYGVKQHISRTIRSLYMLATASGIPADDFHSLIRTELECLSMMDGGGEFGAVTNAVGG